MSLVSETGVEPRIVEFGPYRVIGLRYAGKNENGEIPALWDAETGLEARKGEVALSDSTICFGLCRCLPGATDGSFEYIAALPATEDAPVPEGMVEARIAACTYAAFSVAGLGELMAVWGAIGPWLAAHPEWQPYCGDPSAGCDCENHPSFEYYPPNFSPEGMMYIYMPVRLRE